MGKHRSWYSASISPILRPAQNSIRSRHGPHSVNFLSIPLLGGSNSALGLQCPAGVPRVARKQKSHLVPSRPRLVHPGGDHRAGAAVPRWASRSSTVVAIWLHFRLSRSCMASNVEEQCRPFKSRLAAQASSAGCSPVGFIARAGSVPKCTSRKIRRRVSRCRKSRAQRRHPSGIAFATGYVKSPVVRVSGHRSRPRGTPPCPSSLNVDLRAALARPIADSAFDASLLSASAASSLPVVARGQPSPRHWRQGNMSNAHRLVQHQLVTRPRLGMTFLSQPHHCVFGLAGISPQMIVDTSARAFLRNNLRRRTWPLPSSFRGSRRQVPAHTFTVGRHRRGASRFGPPLRGASCIGRRHASADYLDSALVEPLRGLDLPVLAGGMRPYWSQP